MRLESSHQWAEQKARLTLVAETQDFRRFAHAPAYMGFTALVSSERSTGERVGRGGITKAGNAHLRRILVEAAWCYRSRGRLNPDPAERRKGCQAAVIQVARKAQNRLQRKFWRVVSRGKLPQAAAVAAAREFAGFVWAIAQRFPEWGDRLSRERIPEGHLVQGARRRYGEPS
jgi:transposase